MVWFEIVKSRAHKLEPIWFRFLLSLCLLTWFFQNNNSISSFDERRVNWWKAFTVSRSNFSVFFTRSLILVFNLDRDISSSSLTLWVYAGLRLCTLRRLIGTRFWSLWFKVFNLLKCWLTCCCILIRSTFASSIRWKESRFLSLHPRHFKMTQEGRCICSQ